nr:cupin [Paenibacillus camerounensis]
MYSEKISHINSDFVMSRMIQLNGTAHIGCAYLEADGVIGYHQAVTPQFLLIIAGEGKVRGEHNEYIRVQAGEAVFWQKGEWHETITSAGLTAIVIESESLSPSLFMALK